MGQEITCFLKKRNYEFCNIAVGFFFSYLIFFYLVIPLLFSSEKIDGIGFITITSVRLGKLYCIIYIILYYMILYYIVVLYYTTTLHYIR